MDFDAAFVIRTGSALLWLALGGWMAVRGRKANRAVGVAVAGFAAYYIVNNLFDLTSTALWPSVYARLWNCLPAGASLVAVGLAIAGWAREDGRRSVLPLAAVAACAIPIITVPIARGLSGTVSAASLAAGIPPAIVFASSVVAYVGSSALNLLLLYACVRVACLSDSGQARRGAPLVLLLGMFGSYAVAATVVYPASPPALDAANLALALIVILVAAVSWIVAAARGAGRVAVAVALILLASGLLGLLVPLFGHVPPDQVAADPSGVRGILRTLGWAIFVYAILRQDVLDLGLKQRTINRGILAATSLAALFIVAQVMQNFLSAQYGLLTGGIIAGAVLFVASPVQRAMERLGTSNRPGASGGKHDDAYKAALRVAMADKRLTRDEEVALADVAERLGIGARRAAEIRHDIEQEKGVA